MKKQSCILSFLLCFLFCMGISLKAENTKFEHRQQLRWRGLVPDMQATQKKILTFEDVFTGEDFLPHFRYQFNQAVEQIEIKNIQTVALTPEELAFLQPFSFPDTPALSISTATDKKIRKTLVDFIPIVLRDGVPQKVISFTLEAKAEAKTALRATRAGGMHSYAGNSVLSIGKWVKISVKESGIYKITYEDLLQWGISNPAKANIFGYGGARLSEDFSQKKIDDLPQLSVWKSDVEDFGAGDYLLFYAQGVVSWQYNAATKEFSHTTNPYSQAGYYFVTSDIGEEKPITQAAPPEMPADTIIASFRDYRLHERDNVNLILSGSEWYGERFESNSPSYSFSFSFPDMDTSKPALVYVDAIARSTGSTSMQVSVDGMARGNLNYSPINEYSYAQQNNNGFRSFSVIPSGSTLPVTLKYNQANAGMAWLNFIRVTATRKLNINGDMLQFRNTDISNRMAEFQIKGNAGYLMWDITNPANIKQMPAVFENSQYRLTDDTDTLKEYLALRPSAAFPSPQFVNTVTNQNLHAVAQADYVIITHPDYFRQAEMLARKHEEREGISTLIITPEEIYNEFSSGTPDATAYRWLTKMLYDRAATAEEAPKSLLLLGDGTYDNRGIQASQTAPYSKLLTYQSANSLSETSSYTSDDYFGLLDDDEGGTIRDGLLDIGVGRLPVSTTAQADDMINKIFAYIDNKDKGYWKNVLCYVADDSDIASDEQHVRQADELALEMDTKYPMLQTSRIFLDAFEQQVATSGQTYPQAKEKLLNTLNTGCLLINYTGHGSPETLTGERVLDRNDIENLHNRHWPLFVTATCGFSRFDGIHSSSGEELLLKPDAGAIGLFTTSRTVFATPNFDLNKAFNKHVFEPDENGKQRTLGEIMRRTKNDRRGDSNRLNFTLLADPHLRLTVPENKIDQIEINSTSTVSDTMQALSVVTIKGIVASPEGAKLTQFNGQLNMQLYDKQQKINTLGNDGNAIYTYTERPNILLKGTTTVHDGEFSMTVLIPKDIAYNYGSGRLNFYAADTANDLEANGSFENFVIGGANPDADFEETGPDINMYINSPHFRSGDRLNSELLFVAHLFDESGINTSGVGIGHDLLLTLNDDTNLSYVLNDYYVATDNDFRSGMLSYKLPALPEGNYTLSFRAWDLLNNSSTKSVTFTVDSKSKPALYDMYAYPNPLNASADNQVNFLIRHNQPQTTLNIKIDVYNTSGTLVWTYDIDEYAEGNISVISWQMNDFRPLPGVYACRISVSDQESGSYNIRTNKLIVK